MNGVYDKNEIGVETVNQSFIFEGLPDGRYLIREKTQNECRQLYPGVKGYNLGFTGNGYIDSVVQYYHDGHPTYANFVGGNVNTPNNLNKNSKINWVTGNNPTNL